MNDVLKQYYREIERLLPCTAREKKRCIMELETDVLSFLETAPSATLEELYNTFGSPEIFAEAYMAHHPELLSHKLSSKRQMMIIVIIAVVVLSTIIGVSVKHLSAKVDNFQEGYYIDVIEESSSSVTNDTSALEEY